MSISVILPSYNEALNLEKLLPYLTLKLIELNCDYEILVIDTIKSMDNSEIVAVENGAIYINRENGNKYGDAIRTGISKAKYSNILIMDADGSHDSKYIKYFYENKIKSNYDLVIGSRYIKGGGTDNNYLLQTM